MTTKLERAEASQKRAEDKAFRYRVEAVLTRANMQVRESDYDGAAETIKQALTMVVERNGEVAE